MIHRVVLGTAAALALFACASQDGTATSFAGDEAPSGTASTAPGATNPSAQPPTYACSDAQIVGIVNALNQEEIAENHAIVVATMKPTQVNVQPIGEAPCPSQAQNPCAPVGGQVQPSGAAGPREGTEDPMDMVSTLAQRFLADHAQLKQDLQSKVVNGGAKIQPEESAISKYLEDDAQESLSTLNDKLLSQGASGMTNLVPLTPVAHPFAPLGTFGELPVATASIGRVAPMGGTSDLASWYVSHELVSHLKTLALLDGILIPSAKDPTLRNSLLEAEKKIREHVEMLVKVENKIEAGCRGGGQAAGCPKETTGGQAPGGGGPPATTPPPEGTAGKPSPK